MPRHIERDSTGCNLNTRGSPSDNPAEEKRYPGPRQG